MSKLIFKRSPKSAKAPLPDLDSSTSSPTPPVPPSTKPSDSVLSLHSDSSLLTIHQHKYIPSPPVPSTPTERAPSPLPGVIEDRSRELSISPIHRVQFSTRWYQPPSERSRRPWQDSSPAPHRSHILRRDSVPSEQTVAFERTASAVAKATGAEILQGAKVITHDVLSVSVDVARLIPLPGLAEVTSLLLKIWGFVQQVESNRMACLHLAERCASILSSVRAEAELAGPTVVQTLEHPLSRLAETFKTIEALLQKQAERPFIKRYLKRESIMGQIQECHEMLSDNLNLFGIAVQFRILQEVQAQRQSVASAGDDRKALPAPPLAYLQETPDPSDVLPTIISHHNDRFVQHYHQDSADLRCVIRNALSSNSDAHLIEVLQVQRPEMAEAIKTLQRALEDPHLTSPTSRRGSVIPSVHSRRDSERSTHGFPEMTSLDSLHEEEGVEDQSIHREFIEEEIGALRRLSGEETNPTLPSWTITRWEIDREQQIGVGFFSEVYKGTWNERTVAIKVLTPMTPAKLFLHEAQIWKNLKHPNVLELLGASSCSSDPPWFFVSPYMFNGNLVRYLKEHVGEKTNQLRMIHEIAVGMEYLHGQGVLHGDLKACNVLIDDNFHCVISDFGQSELKSEVYRLSGVTNPKGTLRWLAPELMGSHGHLSWEADVYAFAICCVEVLTDGTLPWANFDDVMVRHLVLERDERPLIPLTHLTSLGLITLIHQCWSRAPSDRPPFEIITKHTGQLLNGFGASADITPKPKARELSESPGARSPSLRPVKPMESSSPWDDEDLDHPRFEESPTTDDSPDSEDSSRYTTPLEQSIQSIRRLSISDGYESPVPEDDFSKERRDERRYRHYLAHPYHPSLVLPLWTPTHVEIGAVGYHKRPRGTFVTLFNAFDPNGTASSRRRHPPSLKGVHTAVQTEEKRSTIRKGIEWVGGFLKPPLKLGDNRTIARQYPFLLHAGHKRSIVVAESTVYRYMLTADAAKVWFAQHYATILEMYGRKHQLLKEDLMLVIGTLDTRDYGLFVNHSHPDGHTRFNVYLDRREGEPFGEWTTDTEIQKGPHYEDSSPQAPRISANKVSIIRSDPEPHHTLVIARLRFKPDSTQPTSL